MPGAGNNVFLMPGGNYAVTDPQTTTVDSLVVAASATLDITGGTFTISNATGYDTNAGTTKVEAGAMLDILPGAMTNSGRMIVAGALDLNNTTINAGTLTNSGMVFATGGGTTTFDGTSITSTNGSVVVDAGSTLDLEYTTATGGALSNAGNVNVTGGNTSTLQSTSVTNTAMMVATNSTLNVQNTTITGGTLTNDGSVDVTGRPAPSIVTMTNSGGRAAQIRLALMVTASSACHPY